MESENLSKFIVIFVVAACVLAIGYGIYRVMDDDDDANGGENAGTGTGSYALIRTNYGNMKVELAEDKAPETVANFKELANDGFYDGLVFHRVIDGFMIQGGGFTPNGEQVTSEQVPFESHPDLTHEDGAISMASTAAQEGGTCQFFICDGAQNSLDGNYAVFGYVVDGMDVVRDISAVQTQTNPDTGMADWPVNDVVINSIVIVSD